jgi:hypothetical protein
VARIELFTAMNNGTLASGVVTEPPDTDPHVGWCERRAAAPPFYSIQKTKKYGGFNV